MSRFWAVLGGTLATVVLLAGQAGARTQVASGDTCTASGSGSQVTLHISIPEGQQQFGFAFRTAGATITNASISGANGNYSTDGATWLSDAALPGAPVVTLTTSGTAKSITVVPSANGGASPTFLDPVACKLTNALPTSTATFSVAPRASYSTQAKVWHLVVTIPGPGTVSAVQPVATAGGAYTASATAKPLVQAHRMTLNTAGKVTLTLRPTSKAPAQTFRVQLRVAFDAQNGTSAHKTVTLTLSR